MVEKLPHNFNIELLKNYFEQVKGFGQGNQVSLTYREGQPAYVDGCGSAYSDPQTRTNKLFSERDFIHLVDAEKNPIFEIVNQVRSVAKEKYGRSIGRVRFMTLTPKSCLSYHRDFEEVRFHIPIITNEKCFFVVDDTIYRMSEPGGLYTLKTSALHTPVNADMTLKRTHLVFSTYK